MRRSACLLTFENKDIFLTVPIFRSMRRSVCLLTFKNKDIFLTKRVVLYLVGVDGGGGLVDLMVELIFCTCSGSIPERFMIFWIT